jgi:hypothetical protein
MAVSPDADLARTGRPSNAVLAAGFAVLLGLESLIRFHGLAPPDPVFNFSAEHGNIAAALASGRGFSDPFGTPSGPTCWVPPVFPAYLALIFLVFGVKTTAALHAILTLDVVLAGLAAYALLGVLDEVNASRLKPAFCAVLLALVALHQSAVGLWLSSAWMVSLMASLGLWLTLRVRRTGKSADWLCLGATTAVALVTHAGTGFACGLCMGVLALMAVRTGPRGVILASLALALTPLSLWTLRNHREFGTWIPIKPTGSFETYLTLAHTQDGVLNDAVMLAHHPYCQADILRAYTILGEKDFLKPYDERARQAYRADPSGWIRGVIGRARAIFAFCNNAPSAYMATRHYSDADTKLLLGSGLAGRTDTGNPLFWTSLGKDREQVRLRLGTLGLSNPDQAFEDWLGARTSSTDQTLAPVRVISGLFLAGIPTLCFLLCALRTRSPVELLPGIFYGVILIPNLLITYYNSHALLFIPLQATVIVLGVASLSAPRKTQ